MGKFYLLLLVSFNFFILIDVNGQENSVSLISPDGLAVYHPSLTSAYAGIPVSPSGNYIIELQAEYTGNDATEIYPIQITDKGLLPGGFTITIRPAAGNNGEIIQRPVPASGVVLQINGGDNIVLDGRPGGIVSSTINYLKVNDSYPGFVSNSNIQLINGANNNLIEFVNSSALIYNSSSRNVMIGGGTASNNDNIIRNNIIIGGARCVYVQADSASTYNNGTIIQNNIIKDFWEIGVLGSSNQANISIIANAISISPETPTRGQFTAISQQSRIGGISNITDNNINMASGSTTTNTIIGINTSGSSTINVLRNTLRNFSIPGNSSGKTIFGIILGSGTSAVTISQNTIGDFNGPYVIQVYGIILTDTTARTVTINKNKVFSLSGGNNAVIYGINLFPGSGSVININNNFISLMSENNIADIVYGLQFGSGNRNYTSNIYYNTIRIGGVLLGGSSGDINSAGIIRNNTGPLSTYNQLNNICINNRGGGNAGVVHTAFHNSGTQGSLHIDYNTYYASFPTSSNAWAAGWIATQYENSNVNDYKAAAAPQEQHSSFTNVNFVSDIDLHLTESSLVNPLLKGIPLPGISDDIDGDARSTVLPTQGADEGVSSALCPGGAITLTSNTTGSNYQWQLNTGNGFSNISDNSNYTGTNTANLQLNNTPSSWYGYQYRCIVDGNSGNVFALQFLTIWKGDGNGLWENPSNWVCGSIPDENTDVIINNGTVVLNSNATLRSLSLDSAVLFTINSGYNLTVTY